MTGLEAEIAAWMDDVGDTRVLFTVLTQPLRWWWADTRASLHRPAPAQPCAATRSDGDFTWYCHQPTHPGTRHHDTVYGTWT